MIYITNSKSLPSLLLLAVLWSPSAVCLKVCSTAIPAFTLISCCMLISAIILIIYLKIQGESLKNLSPEVWSQGFIMGFLCNGLPFTLQAFSAHYIQSIWLGLLHSIVPISTILITHCVFPQKRLMFKGLLGVIAGLIGTSILLSANLLDPLRHPGTTLGLFLGILSSLIYACGLVYGSTLKILQQSTTRPLLHVLTPLTYLIPLACIIDQPWQMCFPSINTWLYVIILSIPSTALAYIAYYKILQSYGATTLSTVNYLLPLLKTSLGIIILNEIPGTSFYYSAALILLSIALITNSEQERATLSIG